MKKIIISLVMAAFLFGCASNTTQNMINATSVIAAYQRMEMRHPQIVQGIKDNSKVFDKDEVTLLNYQGSRIEQARTALKNARASDRDLVTALAEGSDLIMQYGEVKDAFTLSIMIIERRMAYMPTTLQYQLQRQIADARELDSKVQELLTSDDGISHADAVKNILQMVAVAAKLAAII